jgi:hypothetical protein
MRRLRRLACRILGHRQPSEVAGIRDGLALRARICSRCNWIFESQARPLEQVLPRRERRRLARARARA